MSDLIKIRRGTATQLASYTPAAGEVFWTTDSKRIFVGDGITIGSSLSGTREVLTSARTYYVRPNGNDGNSGLIDDSTGAFLTIQAAVNLVCRTLDLGPHNVIIQVADGTYTSSTVLYPYVATQGYVAIRGNVATPSNVLINTVGTCVSLTTPGSQWYVQYVKLQSSSAHGIQCNGTVTMWLNSVHFGSCTSAQILATGNAMVFVGGNYTISGNAATHIQAGQGGTINVYGAQTITVSGTPSIGIFANAWTGGNIFAVGLTFSGTSTGKRYEAALLGIIQTNAAVTYFPGNSAGTTATGGVYA